ncbi:chemotaxis protein CheB [Spongisporangium articulatum]|uniref:protein-glutamate methylesterase n=1 Tax=Spongisporangium articulatum TaxID=3362603 RepID=A0ABW8AU62_9ACTN
MAQRDTIVIGASAGGVEALRSLLGGLPGDLPAAVLVVMHTPPSAINALASILRRSTSLVVRPAETDLRLERGTVVVARPDHHLLLVDDHVILTRGPRENGHRPAVDVLFRSAARAVGPRAIGVVLSGALDDGAAGLVALRSRGGLGVVQAPDDALHAGMPRSAIAAADPEHVVPVTEMAEVIAREVGVEVPDPAPTTPLMETELAMAELEPHALNDPERPGTPAGLSCPDCHGTLFEIAENGYLRYRCRVGHAWSQQSLLAENDAALEGALWMALRSLEEKAALALSMAGRARDRDQPMTAARFEEQAAESTSAATLLRRMLMDGTGIVVTEEQGR